MSAVAGAVVLISTRTLTLPSAIRAISPSVFFVVVASLALAAYQQRLADQFGIEPGAEQRMAVRHALQNHLPVLLVGQGRQRLV